MIRRSGREILIRWYLLIAGIIIALVLSYVLAISKTVDLYVIFQNSNNQKNISENGALEKEHNQDDMILVNKMLDRYYADTLVIKERLLDEFNNLCTVHNCKIKSIGETVLYKEFGLDVINNQIEIEGSYFQLLKIINVLENKHEFGKINSCDFFVINDFLTKSSKLRMKLNVQNISKNENN